MTTNTETKPASRIPYKAIWRGRGHPLRQIRSLLSGILWIIIGIILYKVSLWSARWGMPIVIGAALFLVIAVLVFLRGGRNIWVFFAHLGFRGLLIVTLVPLLAFYISAGLSLRGALGGQGWILVAQLLSQRFVEQLESVTYHAALIPDDLTLAFFGRSLSSLGDTPIGSGASATSPTGTIAKPIDASQSSSSSTPKISIGAQVRVVNTENALLRAHATAGTSTAVSARFAPGITLTVFGGPMDQDGLRWWHVRGEGGEGWCADSYLELLP